MKDAYADIAPYYDLEFDEFDDDVGLYLGYAGIVGSPVLELGCGTGRLLMQLAADGHEVHGLDRSPAMAAIARRRLDEAGFPEVDVRIGDMTDLSAYPADTFRMVFVAVNSFLDLSGRDEQMATLRGVRRILHDDGLLVLDILHPTPMTLSGMDGQLHHDGTWHLPSGERVDRLSHRRLSVTEQRIDTTLYYDRVATDGTVQRHIAEYSTRYIHRFEMEGLLDEAGFVIEGIYGSYQLDPLEDSSSIMLFVAHRRPPGAPLL